MDGIAPAAGYLWHLAYRFDGEEVETMIISAITPDRALAEAHLSLSPIEPDDEMPDYQILGLWREDCPELHRTTTAPYR